MLLQLHVIHSVTELIMAAGTNSLCLHACELECNLLRNYSPFLLPVLASVIDIEDVCCVE